MADNQTLSKSSSKALLGAGLAVAAGTAAFLLARRSADVHDDGVDVSDALDHVFRRKTGRYEEGLVGRTVTIGKSRQEIYRAWRDFTRFPDFMENVEAVEDLGGRRSKWTIKAPLGASVELVTKITEDRPGEAIGWKSEPESDIQTEGRVEFFDIAPGRGTGVRLTLRYDPPAGLPGRVVAKLFQREPNVQARRDLRRFKMLMETGEIATNAGPSGRDEPVTESTT
ncbi:MAG TPA: SRPBCC family protein [Sphingomicrobium sp.]|nr:SRPBCC family protein [Sphingomicrobium sp.]